MSIVEQILELAPGSKFAVHDTDPGWTDYTCEKVQRGPYTIFWALSNAKKCPPLADIMKVEIPPTISKRDALKLQLSKMETHSDADIRALAKLLKDIYT